MLKSITPTTVTYDGIDFAIFPFPAMTAAMISGDLAQFVGPIIAGVIPIIGGGNSEEEIGENSIDRLLSMSNAELLPSLNAALSTLNGENVQKILTELLIRYGNINCEYSDEVTGVRKQEKLTRSLLDELFIGRLDSMLMLALDVVKLNFADFFTGILSQYGSRRAASKNRISNSTENSEETVSIL